MRRNRIGHIEREIADFGDRATELFRREHAARAKVEKLGAVASAQHGRLRRAKTEKALERARLRADRLTEQREAYVRQGLRAIMLSLDEQSRRTRERLDRELERLVPVQEEWERLRGAFVALEATVAIPAVEDVGRQWRGTLAIPEFPVQEREGYPKPFPRGALLF